MKYLQIFALALFSIALGSCAEKDAPDQPSKLETLVIPSSLKSYELYSWPEGSNWKYSFLVGTNRLKTLGEVTSKSAVNLITVTGKDSVKLVFNKFQQGTTIMFFGADWLESAWGPKAFGNLQLPPAAVVDELKAHAMQKGLSLNVTN